MGQPTTIYDKDGNPVVVYGLAQMKVLLGAGHTKDQPLAEQPAEKTARKPRKAKGKQ